MDKLLRYHRHRSPELLCHDGHIDSCGHLPLLSFAMDASGSIDWGCVRLYGAGGGVGLLLHHLLLPRRAD